MVLLNAPRVNGFWASTTQYKMVDSITGTVCGCYVPELGLKDPRERMEFPEAEDWILEMHEWFEKRLTEARPKVPLPKKDQHDLGKTLKEIKASKQRRLEVGHGRYW